VLIGVDGRIVRMVSGADDVRRLLLETCGGPGGREHGTAGHRRAGPVADAILSRCDDLPHAEAEAEEAEALRRYLRQRRHER
jgi:hypothetical protein